MSQQVDTVRCEPTAKRVRAMLRGETVVDTQRALLVWEPQRVVPTYAVPTDDLRCEIVSSRAYRIDAGARPKLGPGGYGPFATHTSDGEELTLRIGGVDAPGIAFRSNDTDLAGYALLDFDAFDAWLEEDDAIHGHPRDPFHRVDVRHSSRGIRIEIEGETIATSARPTIVFETKLPPRFYLPRADVRAELLRPSTRKTVCAYKGEASYHSVALGERIVKDVIWTYEHPLPDAIEIAGLLCFFDERVDVYIEGVLRDRPRTAWSK